MKPSNFNKSSGSKEKKIAKIIKERIKTISRFMGFNEEELGMYLNGVSKGLDDIERKNKSNNAKKIILKT